ncbi:MAG TPA: rhodanese-like domain-containing protein [Rhodocyclaceae bacterium]
MEFIQENITWVLLAVVSGGMLLWTTLKGTAGISVAEATSLINREDGVVVDVRETGEWSSGHIPNARHIALGQLGDHISELSKVKDKPIIVCCASGNRSSSACATLKKAGFERVFNLAGGMGAWRDAGLPVTTKG